MSAPSMPAPVRDDVPTVAEQDGARAPERRRRRRRLVVALGVLGLVLALVIGGGLWFVGNRYGGNIDRVGNVFDGLSEGSRPAAPSVVDQPQATADPVTFLLVGSDTRAEVAPGELPDARSDAIMIARFAADREHAQVISIPRDSYVDIPGHGKDKINAAYASVVRPCSSRPSSS